ncbi:MAG: hypothetical protein ACRENI_14520 [Gemmatimonadaceae bacterium]
MISTAPTRRRPEGALDASVFQASAQAAAGRAASRGLADRPVAWRMPPKAIAARLFLTAWLVYALHFATDVVREHYLTFAIGDRLSFRVDEYANLHPDLFEKPGYGWHIGNNPGVSMMAALPYAITRPLVEPLVARVQAARAARGETAPPAFTTERSRSRIFFAEAWRRGIDVKLGLGALATHLLFMAPSSALAVVLMFGVLRRVFNSDRKAVWLALLYAFGTPVFFRTGFLNHNLVLGHIAFAGFLVMWNPSESARLSMRARAFLGGVAGGTTVLYDYSGVVMLLGLFVYGIVRSGRALGRRHAMRLSTWYVLGSVPPMLLLWWYQYRSFGHPLLPGQHWMPPVEWIELGYQGYGGPQLELLAALAFDHRFGLFVVAPIFALALAAPLVDRGEQRRLPVLEMLTCLGLFVALWVFFAGSNYTRLQWNTGIRYLAPIFPFLFLPAVVVLLRLRPTLIFGVGVFSIIVSWCMAMDREVWHPLGAFAPVASIFAGGFELPSLTTLSRMSAQFGQFVGHGVSPVPVFLLVAIILWAVWSDRFRGVSPIGDRAEDG